MEALARRIDRVRAEYSRKIIREFLSRCQKPYLSWSGGKDSTLMLYLTRQIRPDIQVIYFDADSCLPDGWEFMMRLVDEWGLNFRVVKTRPLLDVIAEHGFHNPKIEQYTLRATVYEPVKTLRAEGYDGSLIGIRVQESRQRRLASYMCGPLFYSKTHGMWQCWPMLYWRKDEIWVYTDHYQIPHHPAYDKTAFMPREDIRVSYWAGETFRTHGRYAWLRRYYPELFRKMAERIPEVKQYV